jgi:peptide/nickel transport system permease protein
LTPADPQEPSSIGEPVPAPAPEPADENARASAPLPAQEGRIVSTPGAEPEPNLSDRKAGRQLLTGKLARAGAPSGSYSPAQLAWRRLRKNRWAMVSGILLILLYLGALFAPFLSPYDYATQDSSASYSPPMRVYFNPWPTVYPMTRTFNEFRERVFTPDANHPIPLRFFVKGEPYRLFFLIPADRHLFGADGGKVYLLGTDLYGRDILSRLLYASQISLTIGLIGIAITFTLGLLAGGISGYYGGLADDVIMRLCEVIMSVPDFYLLLALAATLPPTLPPALVFFLIIAILSFVGWAGMARVIRGMALAAREREYVEAARALGVPDLTIIVRHILPSTFTFAIVAATLSIPGYIMGESALSFLGLGIRDPMPSWGNMLTAAQDPANLQSRPWLLVPGFMIFLTTLAFNFLGDGLRDALDPKSTG